MSKFDTNRTFYDTVMTPKAKYHTPCIYFTPLKKTNNTAVFIFCGGMHMTQSFVRHINHPFFNEHYLLSFERISEGSNQNKPTRRTKPYLTELDAVVNYAKSKFSRHKIYLLGESWGGYETYCIMLNIRKK